MVRLQGYEAEEFDIHVVINKQWKDAFLSFLKDLEYRGTVGSSRMVGFYADGDGDFKVKFTVPPFEKKEPDEQRMECDYSFDAY